MMTLEPTEELVQVTPRYSWELPLQSTSTKNAGRPLGNARSVWYIGLPLTSAHRGSHSGGGALIEGVEGQERYRNEGTVYPHASLVEMITYHARCFPSVPWRYLDMSHTTWPEMRAEIRNNPPDVAAFSVYTATAMWALIVAAEIKSANPRAIVVFGNDHAGILHREILHGKYGGRLVDFVSTGNNGPFTMMGLLYWLHGRLALERVPSLAYRSGGDVIHQSADTYPLNRRILPDYTLIEAELEQHYDKAFNLWYAHHYRLKRMVTLPLDGGCHWGSRPGRRCKHCSIQGLTPKATSIAQALPTLETTVGELGANVYAAGDSTLGFSRNQWSGELSFLDDLAAACAQSAVLSSQRFMLAYGLIYEFLQAAELCQGFVQTWNVGLEAFDYKLLKGDSKGINRGPDAVLEAIELARKLDYKLYISGILGLPGTTLATLRSEVDNWLALTEEMADSITTVSVSAPAVIPGSRMYWECYQDNADVRAWHGEMIPVKRLTELYIRTNTEVELADVEAALTDLGGAVISIGERGSQVKFGGYMLGGVDAEEMRERALLDEIVGGL
jgi:hypothetical protein